MANEIPEGCVQINSNPKIVVLDRAQSALFLNPERKPFVVVRVDGCAVTEGLRVDYLVTEPDCGDVLVELKGRAVEHGIKQVQATLSHHKIKSVLSDRVGALIVSKQSPGGSTTLQKAKEAMKKSFGVKLTVRSSYEEYVVAKLV